MMCKTGLSFFFLVCSVSFVRFEGANALTEEALANRINAFGCNLLHGLYKDAAPEDNILISPVNTYAALALLHLGAADKTRDDLGAVMKAADTKNSTEFHHLLKSVVAKLASGPEEPKFYETVLANGVFLRNDFPLKDSYLDQIKTYYQGEAKNVDFGGNPQAATDAINNWVASATKGRIAHFYEQSLTADTLAVLTSALYFNAKWKHPFVAENTTEEAFHTGVTEIRTPAMKQQNTLDYISDETLHYDSVTLPYSGQQYVMNVYLQHKDHEQNASLADLFHELAQKNFDSSASTRRKVNVKLPKMKFSWKKSVVDALKLKAIFDEPNLTDMTSLKNVKISDMIHATELEVDEKGTIASAATAIEMILFSAPIPPPPEVVNFHVDRPYLVTIKHKETNAILFAGIIRKPMK